MPPTISTNPEYACMTCNGIGWIPPDGEPLTEHEAICYLRNAVNRQQFRLSMLLRDANTTAPEDPRHAGTELPYGGRFVGD